MAVPSLLLEVFLYFGKLWDVVFWVLSFLIFIYKGVRLPYPAGAYELEFACLFMYLLVEPPRLFLGSKGNKTLAAGPLYASCLLGVFVLFLHVYYILGEAAATAASCDRSRRGGQGGVDRTLREGQTFILRADYVINLIASCFVGMQFLLSLWQVAGFSRSR